LKHARASKKTKWQKETKRFTVLAFMVLNIPTAGIPQFMSMSSARPIL